jgi:hypothetical protein
LGAIALRALLAEHGLLAADKPHILPHWTPKLPAASRPPHFTPRATNALVMFCSGALSHVNVWEYKPELIKWHGQAIPGSERLATPQGANGALSQPL